MTKTIWHKIDGLVKYQESEQIMHEYLDKVMNLDHPNVIMLVEHNDVYTAGVSHKPEELLCAGNIPVIYSHRGGKFTYHGPGQRVIYPIINLHKQKDVHQYVRNLERWIINSLKAIGLEAFLIKDLIGIWINHPHLKTPAKIAAIGVKLKKWVSYHGIAVNITTDINKYSGIIPCGISNYPVTSIKEAGIEISFEEFDKILKNEFKKIFASVY